MAETTDNLCDLHIHSNFSDSDLSLDDIFKQAKAKGLRCIAVTDHDTLSGIKEAHFCSQKYGVELIEAIELSVQQEDTEIHVLGYFIDADNLELSQELEQIKLLRQNRLIEMAEILASLGLNVDPKELMSRIANTIPTRLHLALYLLDKGIVNSLSEAFRKYLSP